MIPSSSSQSRCVAQIRWMIRRDMVEVLSIEQQCFEWAWTEEDFLTCLRQRNCIGMVAEYQERVVGYMIYELLPDELHLLHIAVTPRVQRQGVGTQMVEKLKHKLTQQRRSEIRIEVRESNLAAQLFLRSQRFRATHVLRGFFADSGEDAYVMRYVVGSETDEWTPAVTDHISRMWEYPSP
ncbi:MAG: hypothetical protein KatS3mg113_1094 [Planctomycetaceae bacterium]|nr:MAG: hypothetical protein KatS3mg113_1094 [Planctomycetaceae bacterium]